MTVIVDDTSFKAIADAINANAPWGANNATVNYNYTG